MNIRENRGITLTTLVVTIIVLLILAGVATSTGLEAIENTKHTRFVAELKIMQSYVNQWYEDCKPSINSTSYDETFNSNIQTKFTTINAKNATDDEQAQTTLNQANISTDEYSNFYLLNDEQKSALGVEGVSQKVLVSVKNRKVVSYDGLKYKNKMYYTIDDQSGEGIGEVYNVEYRNPNTNAPTIEVTGKSVYYGDTAKNAKYRFTVNVTQGSSYINKGDLYYGKKENGNVRNWQKTANNTLLVDREGTYQFYYKDAAGNISNEVEYVIEPKATLIKGADFNTKMKKISGSSSESHFTPNTNITNFKISVNKPNSLIFTDDNKVSTSNSKYPIYIWFDNGTIWLWSEENWFYTNPVSSCMFLECRQLKNIQLFNFSTQNANTFIYMFYNCNSLESLDLSNFNTSNVNNMYAMFYNCQKLEDLDLSKFNTSHVTDMHTMFSNCIALKKLDLSNFDTSKVKSFNTMFSGCSSLSSLDLSSFNTSNVTSMFRMFYNCAKLQTIYVSGNFVTSALTNDNKYDSDGVTIIGTNSSKLFTGCTNLVGENGTTYNSSNIDATYAHIDGGPSNPGYFTRKENT